ncbi:MAG: amidohydrolase [Dehalococcoidales bacterium]|nr:MAG: amidohydrolase [Dehalococcoidales bacterium]
MIIDVHYHFMRLPADENRARNLTDGFRLDAGRAGVKKPLDEVLPIFRDYMDDPDGDKLVRRMDESGIDITVINVVDSIGYGTDSERVLRSNENCARVAAQHPERLIPMASIDPRRTDAPGLFRKCIEDFNMKGLKWHPDNGYYPNSEESYAVLEVANELGIPLLTHTGPLANSRAKYAHPIHLDDVALDFPNINIIAAHMGDIWWHDWAALAKCKENLYGDLAMWQLTAEAKPRLFRRYLREILDILGPEQVLFGSDGPIFEPYVSNQRWAKILKDLPTKIDDGIAFSDEEVNAILGNNAFRIFSKVS